MKKKKQSPLDLDKHIQLIKLSIIFIKTITRLMESAKAPKTTQKRAKYVRVGEVIPMVFGKLHYVTKVSLNAELNHVSFKLNSGMSIIRDLEETVPTLGNLYACEAM